MEITSNRTVNLKCGAVSTHIKAVKFVSDFLFVGEGNVLRCYDSNNKKCLANQHVFRSSTIHGIISVGGDHKNIEVLIFGGKSFRVYSFTTDHRLRPLTEEVQLEDWIHDCYKIVGPGQQNQAAFVLAHNSLLLVHFDSGEVQKKISCSEKCIIYSAKIINCCYEAIVIASGTVFNEIVIWSPNCDTVNGKHDPIHRLIAHKGVIFSLFFNASMKQLCSTSDDRSLILWRFCCDPYFSDLSSFKTWQFGHFNMIHVFYGHEARVWRSVLLNHCIVSIGEDSSVCFWKHDGTLVKKEKCHNGGSIWCIDVNSEKTIAVTGGSDSGLLTWNIDEMLSPLSMHPIFNYEVEFEQDFPRTVKLLSTDHCQFVLIASDDGMFSVYDISTNTKVFHHYDITMKSFCILALSPDQNFVLLGNLHGDLSLFTIDLQNNSQCFIKFTKKWKANDEKINNIHWVDEFSKKFLVCGVNGNLQLFHLDRSGPNIINNVCKLLLPKCKPHWWSTAALLLHYNNLLVVGDRSGSIHVYSEFHKNEKNIQHSPKSTFLKIHCKNGVTDLERHVNFLYSTGRDGRLLVFSIFPDNVQLLHSVKASCDLEWISRMLIVENDLILLGFRSTDFIAWSFEQGKSSIRVNCGGGHRSWDFTVSKNGLGSFVAIIRKEIYFVQKQMLIDSPIQKGLSGMEYCCVCFLCFKTDAKLGDLSLFACGGEYPALSIIALKNDAINSSSFITLCTLSGHLSSIRAIAKCKYSGENSFLLVTVGGRAQMMIWKISCENEILCEELATNFLWNLNTPFRKPWKDKPSVVFDPQTRYMDVAIWPTHNKNEFYITTACSDSYVRLHIFSCLDMKVRHGLTLSHGEHCIFKMSLLASENYVFLGTGASDGFVNIYNSSSWQSVLEESNIEHNKNEVCSIQPVSQTRLHRSGINSLDVALIEGNNWLICSGGDDNSLVVVHLCVDSEIYQTISVLSITSNLNAHASQITGVTFLSDGFLASTSVDQRVNIWHWAETMDKQLSLQLVESKMSFIPDIAHLEKFFKKDYWTLVVAGQGIESFHFKIS